MAQLDSWLQGDADEPRIVPDADFELVDRIAPRTTFWLAECGVTA